MAVPWKPLEPGALAIAHVSDPHFGSDNADEVWRLADAFLVTQLKPALVLVTGDLVHTPEAEWYAVAKHALDNLRLPYFVCAGNHDRFEHGNRIEQNLVKSIVDHPQGMKLVEQARQKVRFWAGWAGFLIGVVAAVLVGGLLSLAVGPVVGGLVGLVAGMVAGGAVAKAAPTFVEKRLKAWFNSRVTAFAVGDRGLLFETTFADHLLSGAAARPISLGQGAGRWDIGLLALESSRHADCFARGKISSRDMEPLTQATQGLQAAGGRDEFDLCLLMVHHHLFPIRALESGRENNATDLVNATCLVNTGALLERLAEARIDLALHGHEHQHNWGTYESLEEGFAPVRVVAAGSATGNDSFAGCRDADASFNVIILAPDRSVRLRRMVFEGGGWRQERDTDLTLFTPEQVRQSRARRRAMIDTGEVRAAYTNEIVKSIVFTRQRDVQLYWLWTNWKFKDAQVRHRVTNSTGVPVDPVVVLSKGDVVKEVDAEFARVADKDHAWTLEFKVPPEFLDELIDVSVQYAWQGGGLLTDEELSALNHDGRLGDFRNIGFEFWSNWTKDQTVAALEVHLSLPPEYAPVAGAAAVRVRVHEPENGAEYPAESAALQKQLRSLAKGRYSLRVPFPRPNRDYTLLWRPAPAAVVDDRLRGAVADPTDWTTLAAGQFVELLEAFAGPLVNTPFWGRTTLGLYVKSADGKRAERRAHFTLADEETAPPPEPPEVIHLDHEKHLLCQAWWGVTAQANRPDGAEAAKHYGFEPGEIALVCVPLSFAVIGTPNLRSRAVVRIAVRDVGSVMFTDEMDDATIWRVLSLASSCLLAQWFRKG